MTQHVALALVIWLAVVSVYLVDSQLLLITMGHLVGPGVRQAVLYIPMLASVLALMLTPVAPWVLPVCGLVVLGHLAAHGVWVARLRRRLVNASPEVAARVLVLAQGWGVPGPERVMVDPAGQVGPAVLGLWRYDLVLTPQVASAPQEELDVVLAHELAHVAGRDSLRLWLGSIGMTLLGWHPAARRNIGAWKMEIELAADERAAAWVGDGRRYALVLGRWGLRQAGAAGPGWGAALSEEPAGLVLRLQSLVEQRRPVGHLWAARLFGRRLRERAPLVAALKNRSLALGLFLLGGVGVGYVGLMVVLLRLL